MAVTEFAWMPLKPEVKTDQGSEGGKVMLDSFATLMKQPGCQRVYYGSTVEDPSKFYMVIDWDSVDAHNTFMKADAYGPFVKAIGGTLAGAPVVYHVPFNTHPPAPAIGKSRIGATEILTIYFPTDMSSEEQKKFEASFKDFTGKIKADWKGTFEVVSGWAIEELEYESAPGGKAKAFRALIGWDSVQAHHECRDTKVFQDGIHVVRQAPRSVGISLAHLVAEEYPTS